MDNIIYTPGIDVINELAAEAGCNCRVARQWIKETANKVKETVTETVEEVKETIEETIVSAIESVKDIWSDTTEQDVGVGVVKEGNVYRITNPPSIEESASISDALTLHINYNNSMTEDDLIDITWKAVRNLELKKREKRERVHTSLHDALSNSVFKATLKLRFPRNYDKEIQVLKGPFKYRSAEDGIVDDLCELYKSDPKKITEDFIYEFAKQIDPSSYQTYNQKRQLNTVAQEVDGLPSVSKQQETLVLEKPEEPPISIQNVFGDRTRVLTSKGVFTSKSFKFLIRHLNRLPSDELRRTVIHDYYDCNYFTEDQAEEIIAKFNG